MNIRLRHFIVIVVLGLYACDPAEENAPAKVVILPESCQVKVGEQITLALNGQIPSNTSIQWTTSAGEVVWVEQGLNATFTAPNAPGNAEITVSFVSGTPAPSSSKRNCEVTGEAPPPPPNNTGVPPLAHSTVIISEVMGHPCGGDDAKEYDEYVELYNYGEMPIDVGGWWIYDEGQNGEFAGTPDELVAWGARSTTRLDQPVTLDSTVIPPHGYAVVLSFIYPYNPSPNRMPYRFRLGTIILTTAASETIGDDYFGIITRMDDRDTLTLYTGSATIINKVMDAYGTPLRSSHPTEIDDDQLDSIPLRLNECESAERVDPLLPDSQSNWVIAGNSPGDGPYDK